MTDSDYPHAFYRGEVFHRRLIEPRYTFKYRLFNLLVDIDRLHELGQSLRLLSYNRPNLFSFYDEDHLPGRNAGNESAPSLRAWLEKGLSAHGINLGGGRVRLFCYPRIFGFVFNPLSVWYCENAQGELTAIVCEVRNTFGERHCYLIRDPARGALDLRHAYSHPKAFHVSPFLPITGDYEFRFNAPSDSLDIGIVWINENRRSMIAVQRMQRMPVNDYELLKVLLAYPFMTIKVVAAIHWQALKLWVRGARFYRKPVPPSKEISSDV